eukprot:CAMPEP_0185754602 /NCGR_PEP_ID=MMETSP1174-20130828/13229_1 /TAXON_ID=35687 /ORGANISM="Dictyocha speculum, Strain CCMP1381" /LENGTH=393 /DNA_ID=CAMNT_0028432883 /DNA_START=23 /DNA_END=1204 /DNA_ORIENTATION=+
MVPRICCTLLFTYTSLTLVYPVSSHRSVYHDAPVLSSSWWSGEKTTSAPPQNRMKRRLASSGRSRSRRSSGSTPTTNSPSSKPTKGSPSLSPTQPSSKPTPTPTVSPSLVPIPQPTLSEKPTHAPSPNPSAAPSISERPTISLLPTSQPTFQASCSYLVNASYSELMLENYTSLEDAYDSLTYGHANYTCAESMIIDNQQYEKAIPYLWCVLPHCHANCPGTSCPTKLVGIDDADECESAVYNYLGYVHRKKDTPDYEAAEEYYTEALQLWSSNCGALEYLTELYVDRSNETYATKTLTQLCTDCGHSDATTKAAISYLKASDMGVPSIDVCNTNNATKDDDAGTSEKMDETTSESGFLGARVGSIVYGVIAACCFVALVFLMRWLRKSVKGV